MRYLLLLLLPVVLVATRSLPIGIQLPGERGMSPRMTAQAQYQILLIIVFCLTGLLATLSLMQWFPDLGAIITEHRVGRPDCRTSRMA